MRPHLLEISAFGPFAGTVSVDLDDLGASGLLLLHGETGAGKTSVLDALGYALYGKVPGDRGLRGLRSEHTTGLDETFVRLTFSAGGRRYRVRRSPEQVLPKQRGSGVTTRNASVLLEELEPSPRALSARIDEAAEIIESAVGMSAAQFFQVVVLPQGRFAAFLQAPAAQRQELLQQLFGTQRFADVEAALKRRRDELRTQLDTLSADRDAAVSLLGHVSSTDELPSGSALDWALARRVSLASAAEAAEAAAERCELAEASARAAVEVASRQAELTQRRDALLVLQAVVESSLAAIDERRAALAAARAAAPLAPDVLRLLGFRAEIPALVAAADLAGAALAEAVVSCPGLVRKSGPLDPQLIERLALDRLAVTVPMLVVEIELVAREAQLADAGLTVQDAEQRHVAAEADLVSLRERCARLAGSLAADEVKVAGLPALTALVSAARDRAAAAAELPGAELLAVEADAMLQTARAAANDARESWLDLRDRRLLGIAAELAAGLVPGEACAVCGGVDHPRPAPAQDDAVTEALELQARTASAAADAVLEPLREAVALAASVLTELRSRAGSPGDGSLGSLESDLAGLELLAAGLPLRVAELEQAGADLDRLGLAVQATEAALTASRTTLAGLAGATDEQRVALAAARDGASSVVERERSLRRLAEAASSAVAAQAALHEADVRLAGLAGEVGLAASLAGFASIDAVAEAALTDDAVAEAERVLRDYDDEAAAVRSGLADPDLAVDLDAGVDLAAARAAATAAREALTDSVEQRGSVAARAQQAAALTSRIERCEAELAPSRARYDEVAGLAELASGGAGNRLRMSLTSFVLAARLEQVAARASVRLAHMTSGRFTLLHSDEVLDARSRSGLGLAVHDVWTGTQRPTSSLSGGESFMTALSLALGLADVVADEAGGRRIDTLFVDEGFGTLDEKALDRVMEVLDTLRDGGRLVGVVSHVEELQRRVPARLEVVRTESGSWLLPHHAPVGY